MDHHQLGESGKVGGVIRTVAADDEAFECFWRIMVGGAIVLAGGRG